MMRRLTRLMASCFVLIGSVVGAWAQDDCAAALLPRLYAGSAAMVSFTDGTPLNVRDAATRSGNVLVQIPEGNTFAVIDGPTCAEGIYWWYIQTESVAGWVAESVDRVYLVEPVFVPANQLEEGSVVAFAGEDTLILTDRNLASIGAAAITGATNLRASSHQVFYKVEGHLNAIGTDLVSRSIPTPDLMAIADYWQSPDGSQIAWLLFTETEISHQQDSNCGDGIRCFDRDYALIVTDANGDSAREVRTTRVEDRNNGPILELHGWRDDLKAVFVFRNSRIPSATYPEVGNAIYEVLVDSSGTVNTLIDRYLEIREVAVSANSVWLAQEQTQSPYLPMVGSSVIGINHFIDAPALTGDNLFTSSHQYTFSPDGQYFLWVELASPLHVSSATSTIRRLTLVEGTIETLAQFPESSPPVKPVAGPWLNDNLLVWYYDEGIHVMDISSGQLTGFYPQVAPVQVSQVVGVLRP